MCIIITKISGNFPVLFIMSILPIIFICVIMDRPYFLPNILCMQFNTTNKPAEIIWYTQPAIISIDSSLLFPLFIQGRNYSLFIFSALGSFDTLIRGTIASFTGKLACRLNHCLIIPCRKIRNCINSITNRIILINRFIQPRF